MTDMPVSGPHRVYVRRRPAAVAVDLDHFVGDGLLQLAKDFAEDPERIGSMLTELADADSSSSFQTSHGCDDSRSTHERDALLQELLEQAFGPSGAELRVTYPDARRLAESLLAASAPVAVPQQREAGEAA